MANTGTTARAFIERLTAPGKRLLLMLSAALLLLLSLGNPSVTLPRNTYDFLFVLDITGSMYVSDAGPAGARTTRLAFGKQLVRKTLAELPCGSRAGLGVFTEHRSFLLFAPVEICDNHLVISTMIDRIDRRMAWAELSEVAKGLYSGIDSVTALAGMAGDDAAAGGTRLVFMTDGHEAPPVHPTLRPRFRGEPGETGGLIAGIGGATPGRIPRLNENDEVIGYWTKDEVMQVDRHTAGRPSTRGEAMAGIDSSGMQDRIANGTEHLSSLREDYLRQLAAETGLDYLRTTTDEAFARALLDRRHATQQPAVTNVAWVPAALALLCLLYLFGAELPGSLRGRSRTGCAVSGEGPPRLLRPALRGGAAPRLPARPR